MRELLGETAIKRIAEAYKEAPDEIGFIKDYDRRELRDTVNSMFAEMSTLAHFDFVDSDPYDYVKVEPMAKDFLRTGCIKVNTSGNDSQMWGKAYNLMFRAVHDFIHVNSMLDFNYEDEVKAFEHQMQWSINGHISPGSPILDTYYRILRSEIIYQAAYKTYYGEFHVPTQKIILSEI